MTRRLVAPVVIVVVAVLVVAAYAAMEASAPKAKPGFPGSRLIADNEQLVAAASSGKPILVYFSSDTCPTCLVEDEELTAVLPHYGSSVAFVSIKYADSTAKVFQDWSVISVPTIVLVDKYGIVTERVDGYFVSRDDLRQDLERLTQ